MGVDLTSENLGSVVGLRLKCRDALNGLAQIDSYYYTDLQENVRQSIRQRVVQQLELIRKHLIEFQTLIR
jgi:hypothetical protein